MGTRFGYQLAGASSDQAFIGVATSARNGYLGPQGELL